jgi:hypothetical protein
MAATVSVLTVSKTPAQPTPSDSDWQRLWFAMLTKSWSSVAVVPTEPGIDVGRVAEGLVAVGSRHGAKPVHLLKGIGIRLTDVQSVVDLLNTMTDRGGLVVVPVDPIAENPAAVPLIRAATGAILISRLGASRLSQARDTVRVIGKERIMGSVVLG